MLATFEPSKDYNSTCFKIINRDYLKYNIAKKPQKI